MDVINYNRLHVLPVELNYDELPHYSSLLVETRDERFRSDARSANPAAAPVCARPDPGCLSRRRSRPELPGPGRRQTASLAIRHRSAGLALYDSAQSARQRSAPFDT